MMQDWRVSSGSTEIVVTAEGWVEALTAGIGALGAGPDDLQRLSCRALEDGSMRARDLKTGVQIYVRAVGDTGVDLPIAAEPEPGVTDDVLEDLFLRLGEISSCEGVAQASAAALRIALELVPAEAGAVLIRTRAGDGLRFRAASGPAGDRLVDKVIPLDKGIAGYVCQLGTGISIADAHADRRHNSRVDRVTGFTTRALLAVPVRGDTGAAFGCLELINPPRPFTASDFEVAGRVAVSLGTFLNGVYATR